MQPGHNNIWRSSMNSSVTIPYERSFRRLTKQNITGDKLKDFEFCGCGWPQHMLLPRGTEQGADYDIFVMITNHLDDTVNNDESKQ